MAKRKIPSSAAKPKAKTRPDKAKERDDFKVFISSTSEDLKQHREAACDAALASGILPILMEYFAASGEHPPLKACLKKVSQADVVVLMVAHRYGWVPEDQDGGQHKSITWLECEQAKSENKEVLAFLIDDTHAWPTELTEEHRIAAAVKDGQATPELLAEVQSNVEQLKVFKKWIDDIGVRATFTSEKELGWKVSQALAEWKQRHTTPHAPAEQKKSVRSHRPTIPPAYSLETRDELLQRSGLLLSRGDNTAAFYHFTFQDFLAARRLGDIDRERLFEIFCERAQTKEWRSTLSFLFSSELANSREQATRLLNRLIEQLTSNSIGLAVVTADGLETMLGRENRLRPDIEEKFKNICLAAIDNEAEVQARNTLGLALGRLGDPRVVDDLRDLAGYVEIPAGEYAYQDGKQPIEQPFLLSKYPVTNRQFEVFMQDAGYKQRSHWSKEGWQWKESENLREPEYWRNAKYDAPNQPVVGVSFYEAEAFCKWAGGLLPNERQWEAAARGPQGLEYPWGNNWEDGICSNREAGLGVTSPVGLFPRSKSRDSGLEDMAGNVWEWCDSFYSEGSAGRVLRGGSWSDSPRDCRSVIRDHFHPGIRSNFFGFRVART